MENASKALIIAGAILLSILLISLGIMIFNQASDTVGGDDMSKAEIQTFNSRFMKYEGTQKGTTVKAMVNEVRANNGDLSDPDTIVTVNGSQTPETNGIDSKTNYTVTVHYDGPGGRINSIDFS